jgi:hypothetical protein
MEITFHVRGVPLRAPQWRATPIRAKVMAPNWRQIAVGEKPPFKPKEAANTFFILREFKKCQEVRTLS